MFRISDFGFSAPLAIAILLLAIARAHAADEVSTPPPAPAGPIRAGGGPLNFELKFKLPPPPVRTPQEAIKTFKVAPGFTVEVVASEPMIETPLALSWDDQGRMVVLEMRGYMRDMDGTGEDQPIGRVSRLEDTDGDGAMDKHTVFADNLLMPRALMAIGDGALIAEPPNLVFHHDKNGDGVADAQEIVSDQYGAKGGQPEMMANSPVWMMDNWIWSTHHGFRFRYQQGKFTSAAVQSFGASGTSQDDWMYSAGKQAWGFGQWGRSQDDGGRQFFNYNSDLLRADLVPPGYYARNPRVTERTASKLASAARSNRLARHAHARRQSRLQRRPARGWHPQVLHFHRRGHLAAIFLRRNFAAMPSFPSQPRISSSASSSAKPTAW